MCWAENIHTACVRLSIGAFVAICVLLPGDIMNVKKIAFCIVILLTAWKILKNALKNDKSFITFYSFVFPFLLIMHSMVLGNELSNIISSVYYFPMLSLLLVVKYYEVDINKYILNSMLFLMIITIMIAVFDFAGIISIVDLFSMLPSNIDVHELFGMVGANDENVTYYKLYFRTSPLLALLLFYFIEKKKYTLATLCEISLILAGTRACVVFPLFFLILYVLKNNFKLNIKKLSCIFLLLLVLVLIVVYNYDFFYDLIVMNRFAQASNMVRAGHFESWKEIYLYSPEIMIYGQGIGSYFFSKGAGQYIDEFEWFFLDYIRQMGVGIFLIYFLLIIGPFFLHFNSLAKKMGWLTLLLIASTNPILSGSSGAIALIFMYNKSDNT